jgi:methylenetetrahydromethanopterin dehydrogenase
MDVPALIIGDAPGMGKREEMDEQELGYIVVLGDQ